MSPDLAFAAASTDDKTTRIADVWVDIFAAGLVRSGAIGSGPPVVLTNTLRAMPLLESQGPVGWVHTAPSRYQDYVLVSQGQPAIRQRIDAVQKPDDTSRLLRRAGLCLAAVPPERAPAQAMAGLATKALQARAPLLLWGAPQAAGWSAFDALMRQGALQPIKAGGARVMASAGLAGALGDAGLQDAERALALAAQLTRARQADLHIDRLGDRHLRLRLRMDPVLLVAAGAPTLAHHIAHEGRALFNSRGLASILLPWGAACQSRLLLRNVRARIDGSEIALGPHTLAPAWVDYTDHGAFLRLNLPAVAPSRDALLHLSLPREAVPGDGFCDIGAAEFTVETA